MVEARLLHSGGTVCIAEAWSAQQRLGLPSKSGRLDVCIAEAHGVRGFPRSPDRRSMRLGDDFDWLEADQETILQIRRLRRSVCGAYGCSAPPPSQGAYRKIVPPKFLISHFLRFYNSGIFRNDIDENNYWPATSSFCNSYIFAT